jgi:hypothetical protein
MPHVKLTAKQEAFAQGIADGLGQADAYRRAYDAEGMKDNTIYPRASELMKNRRSRINREGTGSVKVAAVKELNAMHGYNEPAKLNINGAMVHEVRRLIVDPNAS